MALFNPCRNTKGWRLQDGFGMEIESSYHKLTGHGAWWLWKEDQDQQLKEMRVAGF